MTAPDVTGKILQYESFINDNLKQDLKEIEAKLIKLYEEQTDYNQLKSSIQTIKENYPDGFKTQLDVGTNIFMQARVPEFSKFIVDIGLDHHLEMDSEETIKYSDIRLNILKKQIDHSQLQAIKIKAHIKLVLLAIHELKNKPK